MSRSRGDTGLRLKSSRSRTPYWTGRSIKTIQFISDSFRDQKKNGETSRRRSLTLWSQKYGRYQRRIWFIRGGDESPSSLIRSMTPSINDCCWQGFWQSNLINSPVQRLFLLKPSEVSNATYHFQLSSFETVISKH